MRFSAHQFLPATRALQERVTATSLAALGLLAVLLAVFALQYSVQAVYADTNGASIAYRSNSGVSGLASVKYREWNPATYAWGAEVQLPADPTTSNIRFAWIEYSPISSKRVLISLQDDGTLDSYVCASACTTPTNWMISRNLADLWTVAPGGAQRPFDIEFEKTSGDLVLVYDRVSASSTQELFYRVMSAGDAYFGPENSINDTTSSLGSDILYSFIRMDSQKTPGSDVLGMIVLDETGSDAIAWRWDGSAWGNLLELTATAAIGNEEDIGVAFETNSGDMIVVAGQGTSIQYNEFSGGAWAATTTLGGWNIGTINWITIKADPVTSSNGIFLLASGDLNDMDSAFWSGSAWTSHSESDGGIDNNAARVMDFAWDNTGSRGVLIWGTANNRLDYKRFSGTSTFTARTNFAETANHPWVQLADIANPTLADNLSSIGATLDTTFDIGGLRWDGASTNPVSTGDGGITTDTTVSTYESFRVAWQRSAVAQTWLRVPIEGLGLTDGPSKNPSKRFFENLGLMDTLQTVSSFIRQFNENLGLSDTRAFNTSRRTNENLGLSDSRFSSTGKSISENLSVADATTTRMAYSHFIFENLAASDQTSRALAKSLNENAVFGDSTLTATAYVESIAENIRFVDSISMVNIFDKSLSESLSVAESIGSSTFKVLFENVGGADLGSTESGKSLSEGIVVADQYVSEHGKFLAEGVEVSDAIYMIMGYSSFLFENVGAGDGNSFSSLKLLSEETGLSDSLANSVAYVQFLTDGIAVSESLIQDILRSLSENLELAEQSSREVSKVLTENAGVEDIFAMSVDYARFITENIQVLEGSSTVTDFSRSFSEAVSVGDGLAMNSIKTMSETLESLDSTSFGTGKLISEGVALADWFNDDASKLISESLAMVDAVTQSMDFVYMFFENLAFTDSQTYTADFVKFVTEQIGINELFSTISTFNKSLDENLALSEGASPVSSFVLAMAENLSLLAGVPSMLSSISVSLTESLAASDEIGNIFLDIYFELFEPLTMAVSFFTPFVAYQNSLVSEGVGVADQLEIGGPRTLDLEESLAFVDSEASQKRDRSTDGSLTSEDSVGKGTSRTHYTKSIREWVSLEISTGIGEVKQPEGPTLKTIDLALSEKLTLKMQEKYSAVSAPPAVLNLGASVGNVSTAFQLLPPAAAGSAQFQVVNNADSTSHVILKYRVTESIGGKEIFAGVQEIDLEERQRVQKTVSIPFLQPGNYHVQVGVENGQGELMDSATLQISVPWLTVYFYPALMGIIFAAVGGWMLMIAAINRRSRKRKAKPRQ